MSGWWSAVSASVATRLTKTMESRNEENLNSLISAFDFRFHPAWAASQPWMEALFSFSVLRHAPAPRFSFGVSRDPWYPRAPARFLRAINPFPVGDTAPRRGVEGLTLCHGLFRIGALLLHGGHCPHRLAV